MWALLPVCLLLVSALVLLYRRHSRLSRDRTNALLSRDRANVDLQLMVQAMRISNVYDSCSLPARRPASLTGATSLPPGPPSSAAGDSVAGQEEVLRSVPSSTGEADQLRGEERGSTAHSGVAPTAPTLPSAENLEQASRQLLAGGQSVPPTPANDAPPAPPCSSVSSERIAPPAPAPTTLGSKNPQGQIPYVSFCRDQRPHMPLSLSNPEREAFLGQQWKALSAAEKAHYQTGGVAFYEFCCEQRPLLPSRLRKAGKEALLSERWTALSDAEKANRAEAAAARRASNTLSTLRAVSDKTPCTNPYQVFCREERPHVPPALSNSQREAFLGERWRALSDAERALYRAVGGAHAPAPVPALHAHPANPAPAPAPVKRARPGSSPMPPTAPLAATPLAAAPLAAAPHNALLPIGTVLGVSSNSRTFVPMLPNDSSLAEGPALRSALFRPALTPPPSSPPAPSGAPDMPPAAAYAAAPLAVAPLSNAFLPIGTVLSVSSIARTCFPLPSNDYSLREGPPLSLVMPPPVPPPPPLGSAPHVSPAPPASSAAPFTSSGTPIEELAADNLQLQELLEQITEEDAVDVFDLISSVR